MDDGDRDEPLTFVGRPIPPWARIRVVTIEVGGVLAYEASEWSDALVVVESGEVELEGLGGQRSNCPSGDVVWFAGLGLCAVHNHGSEPAVLSVVSRKPDRRQHT